MNIYKFLAEFYFIVGILFIMSLNGFDKFLMDKFDSIESWIIEKKDIYYNI